MKKVLRLPLKNHNIEKNAYINNLSMKQKINILKKKNKPQKSNIITKEILIPYRSQKFIIYGCRNSGTNFIRGLLKANFNSKIISNETFVNSSIFKYWKHGYPEDLRPKNDDLIHIFLVRNLRTWLLSTFYNRYHFLPPGNYSKYLNDKMKTVNPRSRNKNYHPHCIDNNLNIFEIRYTKLKKYLDYMQNNKNCILVRLEYLQSHTVEFLNHVYETFKINKKVSHNWKTDFKHTKTQTENKKNRDYKLDDTKYLEDINSKTNWDIENQIPDLIIKTDKIILEIDQE